ncbi:unnamed protein product [Schistosoma mattheei]|uniref:Uncharacterized protein n=1 Tax=Schistosoma mattheei TaxID=31246 RepID=A0A183NEY5_9TREM|nr:unnamed protein product [Schistosoma mattheei]
MSHKRKHDRRFASFSPKYINMLCHDDINQTFSPSNQNNHNNNNNNNENDDLININENKINKIDFNIDIHTTDLLETNTSMNHLKQSFHNEFQLLHNDFNNNFNDIMTTNDLLNKLSKFVAMCIYRRENWEHILLKINNFDDNLNYEHLLLYKKIDKILISIYQSYNQYLNKCFWPGCHSNINSNTIDTTTTTSTTTTTTTTTTYNNNNDNNGSNANNNDDDDVKQYEDSSKTWCKYWLSHLWEACLSFYAYIECNQSNCPIQSNNNDNNNDHIHCRFWPKCNFINLSNQLNFQILYKHFLSHNEYLMTNSLKDNQNQYHVTMDTTYNNLINPKRRGRPPKYAKHIYVPHINPPEYLCIDNQYTIDLTYSMFFDPIDNNIDQNVLHNRVSNYNTMLLRNNNNNNNEKEQNQFKHIKYAIKLFLPNEICPDMNCPYYITHEQHYHCVKPRCYMSTNKLDLINIHRREFHQHTIIEKGFEYYDISIDCRRPLCHNNKINKHFHCIYPNCDYTFIRSSTMQQHLKKHTENLKTKQNIINKTQNINQSIKDCTEDSSLPGLQPNWTASMVTNVNDVTMGSISSPVKIDCSSECTNECL